MIQDALFYLFAAAAVVSALFVITRRNPVASVMFLVITFFSLSGMFVILDAHFIAAVQVLVYAGAIMVLFLFVVMLLNLGEISGAEADFRGALGKFGAGTLGAALLALVGRAVLGAEGASLRPPTAEPASGLPADPVQAALEARGAVGAVAGPLFEDYLVPFEITSLLLLVAIVGAIVLARREEP